MNKILTMREIEAQFKSEWVLLENPVTSETLDVKGGKVACHSKDRDEVYRAAVALKPKHFAVVYTGKPRKNTAIVL